MTKTSVSAATVLSAMGKLRAGATNAAGVNRFARFADTTAKWLEGGGTAFKRLEPGGNTFGQGISRGASQRAIDTLDKTLGALPHPAIGDTYQNQGVMRNAFKSQFPGAAAPIMVPSTQNAMRPGFTANDPSRILSTGSWPATLHEFGHSGDAHLRGNFFEGLRRTENLRSMRPSTNYPGNVLGQTPRQNMLTEALANRRARQMLPGVQAQLPEGSPNLMEQYRQMQPMSRETYLLANMHQAFRDVNAGTYRPQNYPRMIRAPLGLD